MRDCDITTAHISGPIAHYKKGILAELRRLEQTVDGHAALEGEVDSASRVAKREELLRDAIRVGREDGELNTNAPAGLVADHIKPLMQRLFLSPGTAVQPCAWLADLACFEVPAVSW